MSLPVVLADHGSVALSIAFAGPVVAVTLGIAFLMWRDRRRRRER